MFDFLTLGPTPCEEACAQLGSEGYLERARAECAAFRHQLERMFPVPDGVSAGFMTKSFAHDFGTYYEVCVRYDMDDGRACDFAYHVEHNIPTTWDDAAREELARLAPVAR